MFNKKTKIFLLLIMAFIAVMGVSAATAATTDNNMTGTDHTAVDMAYDSHSNVEDMETNDLSNHNMEISKKTSNVKKADGGSFTDLNSKITDGGEVTLENDYIKRDDESPIAISKNVDINANGKTIQSDNGMFTVNSAANVTFRNVNFVSGSGSNSAFTVSGVLNLINCTFTDHNSNARAFDVNSGAEVHAEKSAFSNIGDRGAFYLASRTTAEFKDCEFTNCVNTVYGGALTNYRSGTLSIDNCTFTDNTASLRGGAVYSNGGTLIIKNSVFTGNTVLPTEVRHSQGGKAVYVEGDLYLYNNTMTNNHGVSADIYNSYATIHTPVSINIGNASCEEGSKAILTASILDDNGNTIDLISESTAISGLDETSYLTRFNFTIGEYKYNVARNNSADTIELEIIPQMSVGEYEIGAQYWTDEFKNATVNKGMLNISETPLYSYAKIQNILTQTDNSTITLDYDVKRGEPETIVNVTRDVIIDLNANKWDANNEQAFEIGNGATLTVKNGIIVNVGNSLPASSNSYGRLARVNTGKLVFENVTFTNSSAPDFSMTYQGSLVRLTSEATLDVRNSTIENIHGRFVVDEGYGRIDVDNSLFNNNNLGSIDSLIDIQGITTITNTQFNNNSANWAIIHGKRQDNLLTLNNVSFTENVLSVGAPVVTGADTSVSNSLFYNNRATRMTAKSGAFYTNGGSLTVTNTTFIGNTANDMDGSVIYHSGYVPGNLNVTNSIIIPADNKAAIYNAAEGTITAVVNYNYWGTNSAPANYVKSGRYLDDYDDYVDCSPIELDCWVVMNTSVTPDEGLEIGDTVTIETSYNTYTDGSNYYSLEGHVPDMNIQYTASSGTIEPTQTTEEGVSTIYYKVKSESTTITATDSYNTNVLHLTATKAQPQIITLNDANWSCYFDADGAVNESVVKEGSELRFEGAFKNRDMLITIPLNITTAQQQAVFNQCSITVFADNVNITNLQMSSQDMDYSLILLDKVSNVNVINNTLNLTNRGDKIFTCAIEVDKGSDNSIKENTITTIGPEDNIVYGSSYNVELVYTTSVLSSSENMIIDNNTIITKSNNKTEELGTIYGIYLHGASEDNTLSGSQVTNNNLITEGKVYEYAIKMDWLDNVLIENNTICSASEKYASGIDLFVIVDSAVNNNTVNINANSISYAIVLEGAKDFETGNMLVPKNTLVSGNTLSLTSKYSWGIEAYAGEYNTIEYNNVTVNADYAVGMGITDQNTKVRYNNISVTATMSDEALTSYDYIDPYTAGIKIVDNGLGIVECNELTGNNVTVTAPISTVSAVNVTTDNNVITNNYFVSPRGNGNDAVIDDGNSNTVKDNIPEPVIKKNYYLEMVLDSVLTYKDEMYVYGTVSYDYDELPDRIIEFTLNGESLPSTTTSNYGDFTYILTADTIGTNNLTIRVVGDEEFNDYIGNYTIEVNKATLTIMLDNVGDMLYNDETWIMGEVSDNNGNELDVIELNIKFNNETYTTTTQYGYFSHMVISKILGKNNVTVSFAGNEHYNNVTARMTYNVYKSKVVLSIDDLADAKYGQEIQISGDLCDERDEAVVNETIHVTINGVTSTVTTNNWGMYEFLFRANTLGQNNVTVSFDGSYGYGSDEKQTTFHVTKQATEVLLDDVDDAKYNNEITVTGYLQDTSDEAIVGEYVDIIINGIGTSVMTENSGLFYYVFRANVTGVNNVSVVFNNSDNYIGSSAKCTFNVAKLSSGLSLDSISPVKYDSNVTLSGKLLDEDGSAIVGESVEISINGYSTSVITAGDGSFSYVFKADVAGLNNVNVTFKGTANYIGSTSSGSFTVEKLGTFLSLDSIASVKYDGNVTLSGKLVDENDKSVVGKSVELMINDENITVTTDVDGCFVHIFTANITGINVIEASFEESEEYLGSNANTTFTVTKLACTLSLNSIDSTKLNSIISISGRLVDENGNAIVNLVRLLINNGRATIMTDSNGEFVYNYKVTKIGETNITATFDESDNYLSSNASTKVMVTQLNSQIIINKIEEVKVGSTVTITGQLLDENGESFYGSVKLLINSGKATIKSDAEGRFTYEYVTTHVGVNNLSVTYLGSDKYATSNATATFNVMKKGTQIVFNSIKSDKLGSKVNISGQLLDDSGKGIYGSIKLYINGARATIKTDAGGKFSYEYTTSRVGVNTVTASYLESNKYTASNSTTTFDVLQKGTQIIINSIESVQVGEKTTISGQLLDDSGKGIYGSIKLYINGARVTIKTDADGVFSYEYTTSRVGVNNVTACYLESAKYTASNTTATVTITPQNTVISINPIKTVTVKSTVTISGQLSDKNGKGIYGSIKLTINNGRATVKTDSNGVYSYTYTTSRVGVNNITAMYLGSDKYLESNAKSTFTVQAKP